MIFTLHRLNEETVVYRRSCIVPLLMMNMLIWEHYLQLRIFYFFFILSLIQVWFLSSRRKEASIWKPWPSLIWREDRTVSLQGLFSDRECFVMCAFKCNQRRSESWKWFSQGLYLRELRHLKFHTIEICQFNLIVTVWFASWSCSLKCCAGCLLSLGCDKTWLLLLSTLVSWNQIWRYCSHKMEEL